MTTTTTRVRLYDIDTGAYAVSSDGNSVGLYGAAYFAGAALDRLIPLDPYSRR